MGIIGRILSFIFILLTALVTINSVYQRVALAAPQQTTGFITLTNLSEHELNVAFFGSSHTQNDVNPAYIPDSYNFGASGLNHVNSFHRLSWLKKNGFKIDTAVFEIDMVIFTSTVSDNIRPLDGNLIEVINKNHTQQINFTSTRKTCFSANEFGPENRIIDRALKCMPVIGHGANFFLINQSESARQSSQSALGWYNASGDFSRYSKEERMKMARDFRDFRKRTTAENLIPENSSWTFFLKSLDTIKNDSKIVLIIYPVSKEYDRDIHLLNISKRMYYSNIMPQIKASGVEYYLLDYYDVFFENPEYFDNAGHLNIKGANAFSKMLHQDLKKRLLVPYW